MRIDLPIPCVKPFGGGGIAVIDYLLRIPRFPEPNTKIDGFPVDVVDTTGAGDVFHGAFLCGLLQGWEAGDILRFTNAVSARKCTCLGELAAFRRLRRLRGSSTRGQAKPPRTHLERSQHDEGSGLERHRAPGN
jgi:hypothetical protein